MATRPRLPLAVFACAGWLAACSGGAGSPDAFSDDGPAQEEEPQPADDGVLPADESNEYFDGWDGGEEGQDAGGEDGGAIADHDPPDAADAGGESGGPSWRESLATCWLETPCRRALVVSHGGDWNVSDAPFLSRAAFEKAYALGADGIELDVRVTADGVAVVAHSSPIEFYESLDCAGRKIEEMTAAEVTGCHLAPSLTQTFQRLDDALDWAAGKIILELDVKETADLEATLETIQARGAADRAFLLVSAGEILNDIPRIPDWERFHYMVNIGDPAQVDAVLPAVGSHRVFLFEMDRSYDGLDQQGVAGLIAGKILPGGVKAFCGSDKTYITVQAHQDMYHQGFDVVLSYSLSNGIEAARQVNQERGYTP